ncbi:MAG: hypothetical protein IJQ81_14140 [Oscillibacter sp.]|nr:hypothetical protein [Oscillibacter sp.]
MFLSHSLKHWLFFLLFTFLLLSTVTAKPLISGETIVYISPDNEYYHAKICKHTGDARVNKTLEAVTVKAAMLGGYKPCGTCNPGLWDEAPEEVKTGSEDYAKQFEDWTRAQSKWGELRSTANTSEQSLPVLVPWVLIPFISVLLSAVVSWFVGRAAAKKAVHDMQRGDSS